MRRGKIFKLNSVLILKTRELLIMMKILFSQVLPVFMIFSMAWHLVPAMPGAFAESSLHVSRVKNQVEKPVQDAISVRQKTQQEREKWLADREKMLKELEGLEAENSSLATLCQSLDEEVSSAEDRILLKERELQGIRQIKNDIQPFLHETLEWLSAETEQGLPFLSDERKKRMDRLRGIMDDPAVSISEKFRKIMETLLIEAEYGTTVDVGRKNITLSGEPVVVSVLRLGRLNLFYQTLDGSRCGVFDVALHRWKDLSREYNRDIRLAMDMALKRRPVELVNLPVGRVAVK